MIGTGKSRRPRSDLMISRDKRRDSPVIFPEECCIRKKHRGEDSLSDSFLVYVALPAAFRETLFMRDPRRFVDSRDSNVDTPWTTERSSLEGCLGRRKRRKILGSRAHRDNAACTARGRIDFLDCTSITRE